jgi:hypothetical protein
MHSPVEKKFSEYLGNIHALLREDITYMEEPAFINNLLDRMEYLKRNFILLSSEKEDVFIYQKYLANLSAYAGDTLSWVEQYNTSKMNRHTSMTALLENIFLMSDLFTTSQNLIKSFYPVI